MRLPVVPLLLCCCATGCVHRYYHWGKAQFEQVTQRSDCCALTDTYLRSFDRYDEFATVGHFDILWYAPEVMGWHLEQFKARSGCTETETYRALEERVTKDNETCYVFYLLMSDETMGGPLQPLLSLNEKDKALWTASLCIGDTVIAPSLVEKLLNLSPELARCFDKRYDPRYRAIYKIHFPRAAADKEHQEGPLRLRLRSVAYEVSAAWDQPSEE